MKFQPGRSSANRSSAPDSTVSLAHAEDVDGLDISYCGLSDQHANLLRLHGSLRHIVSLFIAGNPTLHGAGLAMIASALEISGQLLYLDVTDCQLNANDSASLNEILARNPVIDLTLDVNPLSAEFLRQLQPSLLLELPIDYGYWTGIRAVVNWIMKGREL